MKAEKAQIKQLKQFIDWVFWPVEFCVWDIIHLHVFSKDDLLNLQNQQTSLTPNAPKTSFGKSLMNFLVSRRRD